MPPKDSPEIKVTKVTSGWEGILFGTEESGAYHFCNGSMCFFVALFLGGVDGCHLLVVYVYDVVFFFAFWGCACCIGCFVLLFFWGGCL